MYSQTKLFQFVGGLASLVFSLVEALLTLRFVFKLFAANNTAPFVSWLYTTTDVLLSPFRGIFVNPVVDGHFIFDITSLIALVIYALVLGLVLRLTTWVFGQAS